MEHPNRDAPRREPDTRGDWPPLPLEPWRDTYETLHMWSQIVGKTRLALAPAVNHWWHVPLYVSARGLTTTRMPYGERGFEVELDFVEHRLTIDTDRGKQWSTPLRPRTVADFYGDYMEGLRTLGFDVHIWPHPVEVAEPIPFDEDDVHGSYEPETVERFRSALAQADRILQRFRGRFLGKCSPVHFFWGSFDLACTRFSGRAAPTHPGGVPHLADWVAREAYSHECISAGWWPGTAGSAVSEPAFYAYAYPEPDGCSRAPIQPSDARYEWELREWVLPYEAARTADERDANVMAFLESTYATAAELGGWSRDTLERWGDE